MRKLEIEELGRMNTEEYRCSSKIPVCVILDDVRSVYNVGSVFRTSDSFRIENIVLCGITATPDDCLVEIHKTALGAENTVDWYYEKDVMSAVEKYRHNGYKIVAVEQVEGSTMLDSFTFKSDSRYALIFGNEVKGVNNNVVNICDMALEIPQFGTKHSLNFSVSAGIVLWEAARQLVGNFV